MRKSKFTESQIMAILGEGEAGLGVAEVCRKHDVQKLTFRAISQKLNDKGFITKWQTAVEELVFSMHKKIPAG